MINAREWTLSEAARLLDEPQHRLIYLCEKGVVSPDLADASGRGSSRKFSDRNLLEFAVALKLRELLVPAVLIGAVLYVLRAFEKNVQSENIDFSLPKSLLDKGAPELKVIIVEGPVLYFSMVFPDRPSRVLGGIKLDQLISSEPGNDSKDAQILVQFDEVREKAGAKFKPHKTGSTIQLPDGQVKLEANITEIARNLSI